MIFQQDILDPAVGMEFESIDDAFHFYKDYAIRTGFAIVKRSNHKKEGVCQHYAFACSKRKKVEERDVEKPPLTKRK